MTSYGFKLLKVHLYIGQGQTAQEFGKVKYLDKVQRDVEDALNRRIKALEHPPAGVNDEGVAPDVTTDADTGEATIVASNDVVEAEVTPSLSKAPKRQSVVRFEAAQRLNSGVLLNVQYGVVGDHEKAVDPEEKKADADLKSLATTRRYRVLLITPSEGATGFLAAEVISRSHAGVEMPRRLYQAATGHEYKLRAKGPVADEPAVKELLEHGAVEEVQLLKTFIPSDSSTPAPAESVTMTFQLGTATSKGTSILERISKWNFFQRKETTAEPGEATQPDLTDLQEEPVAAADDTLSPEIEANALAAILWQDASALGFDNAKVKVKSPKQNKTLQPLDFKEGFIYDIGEERLTDDEFVEKVNEAASLLFSNYEMDMEDDWYLPKPLDEG